MSLTIGDPAPWFLTVPTSSPDGKMDIVGGTRSILFFFGSGRDPRIARVLMQWFGCQSQLEGAGISFYGVTVDERDQSLVPLIANPQTVKFLWDFDGDVSARYGVCQLNAERDRGVEYNPTAFVLDENLRIVAIEALAHPDTFVHRILQIVNNLPAVQPPHLVEQQAPILLVPNVLEPSFCQHLIHLYETQGCKDSGFMEQRDGKTYEVLNYDYKRRQALPQMCCTPHPARILIHYATTASPCKFFGSSC